MEGLRYRFDGHKLGECEHYELGDFHLSKGIKLFHEGVDGIGLTHVDLKVYHNFQNATFHPVFTSFRCRFHNKFLDDISYAYPSSKCSLNTH